MLKEDVARALALHEGGFHTGAPARSNAVHNRRDQDAPHVTPWLLLSNKKRSPAARCCGRRSLA